MTKQSKNLDVVQIAFGEFYDKADDAGDGRPDEGLDILDRIIDEEGAEEIYNKFLAEKGLTKSERIKLQQCIAEATVQLED